MHGYANTMFYLKFFEQAGEPMVEWISNWIKYFVQLCVDAQKKPINH